MTSNQFLGIISSLALFLPITLIIRLGLYRYRSFAALLTYYSIFFIYNILAEGFFQVSPDLIDNINIGKNILDGPLMLTFLTYFSTSPMFSRKIKIGIAVHIVFIITTLFIEGYTTGVITIIMGPVLVAIGLLSGYLFIRQTKVAVINSKAVGKAFIAAGLLFGYGCYMIIYLMYYVFKTPYVADTFMIYFMVVTVSCLAIATGIYFESKRIRKLSELKITRRELLAIYKDEKTTAPLRTVALDFDQEPWN